MYNETVVPFSILKNIYLKISTLKKFISDIIIGFPQPCSFRHSVSWRAGSLFFDFQGMREDWIRGCSIVLVPNLFSTP